MTWPYLQTAIVNVVFVGEEGARDWVLIDAGIYGSAAAIVAAAERRFGPGARPAAIVMTHGHFDHLGTSETLSGRWYTPDLCTQTGVAVFDRTFALSASRSDRGRGFMAAMPWAYPRGPIDLGLPPPKLLQS